MSSDRTSQPDSGLPPITEAHLEHMALFPLPGGVFFPHTRLPLHVFEPRYRAMTEETLADRIPIAVVKLTEPRTRDAAGRPAYHPVGCVGFVTHHQRLPDGRYNILLEGVSRIRVLEERDDSPRPYRVARAVLLAETTTSPQLVSAQMNTLQGIIVGLRSAHERLAEALTSTISYAPTPSAVADALASLILSDASARQRVLEELSVSARLDAVTDQLTQLIATAQRGPAGAGSAN